MIKFSHRSFTIVEIMIVLLIVSIVLAIALPTYLISSTASKKTVCINNLKQIDGAIDRWVVENGISDGAIPSDEQEEDIYSNYVKGGKPKCPSGGIYTIYQVGRRPQVRCSLEEQGHKLPE